MDLDAMAKQVDGLKKFRHDAEEAIAFFQGLKLAGFKLPDATTVATDGGASVADQIDDVKKRLAVVEGDQSGNDSFADRLTSIESKIAAGAGNDVVAIDGSSIAVQLGQLHQRVDELETKPIDWPDGLAEMLAWFNANKDSLDVLLSLDGVEDQPEPEFVAGETSQASTDAAGGISTGEGSTAPFDATKATTDAPGTVQG
jgi:hypothetical protein